MKSLSCVLATICKTEAPPSDWLFGKVDVSHQSTDGGDGRLEIMDKEAASPVGLHYPSSARFHKLDTRSLDTCYNVGLSD